MYSPPYVNPSFARTCRHYECIGGCGGGRSSAVSRSSRPSQLAAAQQRADQLSQQQRLIRAALDRAAPLKASRRSGGWSERSAGQPDSRSAGQRGRQDRMLVADARRAADLLRRQEQQLEQEWQQERRRQERDWERQELEWERGTAARRSAGRRRQPTPDWEEEDGYYY